MNRAARRQQSQNQIRQWERRQKYGVTEVTTTDDDGNEQVAERINCPPGLSLTEAQRETFRSGGKLRGKGVTSRRQSRRV